MDEISQSLVDTLQRLSHHNDATLPDAPDELHPFIADEQSYILAQALLHRLQRESHANHDTGKIIERISDDLDQLLLLQTDPSSSLPFRESMYFTNYPPSDLVMAVSKVINNDVQSSDVMKVRGICTQRIL